VKTEYQSVGLVEDELVEQIAYCIWKLKRIMKIETGEWDRLVQARESIPGKSMSDVSLDAIGRYERNARTGLKKTIDELRDHQDRRRAEEVKQK
jgi:hypothetical protein